VRGGWGHPVPDMACSSQLQQAPMAPPGPSATGAGASGKTLLRKGAEGQEKKCEAL